MLHLLEYALISLARRRIKSLMLMLVYAFVIAFYASVVFFTASLKEETLAVLQNIPELWVQKITGGRLAPISQNLTDSLRTYRGIKTVQGRIWGYVFDASSGGVFTIWGADSAFADLGLIQTEYQGKLQENQALVGLGILNARNLQVGDYLTISETEGDIQSFQIVGTFTAQADLLTHDLVILAQKSARKLVGLAPDELTDLAVRIKNTDETETIGRKIDAHFPTLRVVTRQQLRSTYETLFGWRGGIFVYGSMMAIFAFLILVWERTAGLTDEERKEIGILKGIGWQVSDILKIKLFEASIISITATLSGLLIAYFHVFWANAPLLKPFMVGWSVLYPTFELHPSINIGDVLTVFSLSVIPYLTATLIPAWKGAITDPAESLR